MARVFDAIMHIKSKAEGSESAVEKNLMMITRYANVLGAPHLVDMKSVQDAFPDEYLLLTTGDIIMTDAEFMACFGDLVTKDT